MNKLLKSAKSYAITAHKIVTFSENVKKYVSDETYAFITAVFAPCLNA